jgi:hypothetical protein
MTSVLKRGVLSVSKAIPSTKLKALLYFVKLNKIYSLCDSRFSLLPVAGMLDYPNF